MSKLRPFLVTAYQQIFQIFSANLLKAFLGFVGTVFVLRGWSTSDIGDIYILVGVMLLMQQFGDLGTGSSFIQIMSRSRSGSNAIVEPFLGFKYLVVTILLLFFTAICCIYFFVSTSREILGLGVICLASILGIMGGFFTGLITARQEFTKLSYLKVVPPAVKTALIVVLYFAGYRNFFWLLVAFVLPNLVLFIMGYAYTRYPIYKGSLKSIFSKRGRQLYEMSRWVFLYGFAQTWFSQLDIFMLKRMSSDYQIAQFVSAQKLAAVVLMFSQAIFTVMLPKMRSFRSDEELRKLSYKFFKLYLIAFVLMLPLTSVFPYVVPALLGGRYLDSIPILKVFVFQALGYMFISSQTLIFYRKNLLPWLVLISVVQLACNFVGNYFVIHEYKALGTVWVSTILNNLFYIFMMIFCLSILQKPKKSKV